MNGDHVSIEDACVIGFDGVPASVLLSPFEKLPLRRFDAPTLYPVCRLQKGAAGTRIETSNTRFAANVYFTEPASWWIMSP